MKAIIYARKEKYCIFILISHRFDVPLQRKTTHFEPSETKI